MLISLLSRSALLPQTSLQVITFMLTLYQKKKNVHTSGVLFTFWLFFTIFDVISYCLMVFHAFNPNVSFLVFDNQNVLHLLCTYAPNL